MDTIRGGVCAERGTARCEDPSFVLAGQAAQEKLENIFHQLS